VNAGLAFATTLAGTLTFDGICKLNIPVKVFVMAALVCAFVQALVAFFCELSRQVSPGSGPTGGVGGNSGAHSTKRDRKHNIQLCALLSLMTPI